MSPTRPQPLDRTFLEALAAERERQSELAERAWQDCTSDARRYEILDVLHRSQRPLLAADVAAALGVPDTHRIGSGAVAGSWSGCRSAALRVVPMLRSLVADGLASSRYQHGVRTRSIYAITGAGAAWLEARS